MSLFCTFKIRLNPIIVNSALRSLRLAYVFRTATPFLSFSGIVFPEDDCGCVAGARLAGASVYRSPPPTKVGVAHAWCLFAQISKVLWIFFAIRFEYILILGEVNDLGTSVLSSSDFVIFNILQFNINACNDIVCNTHYVVVIVV